MKKIGDIIKCLPEVQPECSFKDFDVIETVEDPPSHYQLKFPGDTVAKRNDFVRYRVFIQGGKDPIAYRLFAHIVACYHNKKDEDLGICQVAVRDFMPDSGGKDYARAKQAMRALKAMLVDLENPDEYEVDSVIYGPVKYNRSNGTVSAQLNPALKDFFLKLFEDYTTYGLLEFTSLRSFYSQRLFEIACSIRPKTVEIFPLNKLQKMLDITTGSLVRYSDFKRWVLEPAKKEINKYTNMKFDYESIKNGRAVAKIKIKARRMNTKNLLELE